MDPDSRFDEDSKLLAALEEGSISLEEFMRRLHLSMSEIKYQAAKRRKEMLDAGMEVPDIEILPRFKKLIEKKKTEEDSS